MNETELINTMTAEFGLNKVDSKRTLETFFSSVTKALSAGDEIPLVGFGTFSIAERVERSDISPSAEKVIIIPAKKIARFKPGAELADAIE